MSSELSSEYRILRLLLTVSGAFLMCACFALLLPVETMRTAHEWLGLGDFPAAPITDYLARSTALLYAAHGIVTVYTGLTIQYHWRFVPVLGWLHVGIGLSMLAIDLHAPMPMYWTAMEGGPIAALGVCILVLAKRGTIDTENSAT